MPNHHFFFTIVANNYFSYALTLRDSLQKTYGEKFTFFVVICDKIIKYHDTDHISLIHIDDLQIPDLYNFKFRYDVISTISKVQVEAPEDVAAVENQWQQSMSGMTYQHINADKLIEGNTQQPLELERKVGRNEPCPCGSGKKFKQCHGKIS